MTISNDSIKDYLRNIGRTPLLTAEQEVELARRVETGSQAQQRLDSDQLSTDERRELTRVAADGRRARDHMVEANLRLVVSIAKRYAMVGALPLLDLIQEGTIGLMRAVEKFDHTLGLKFSTYAVWWIRQAIGRALADQSRTIRLPVHVVEVLNRINQAQRSLAGELGRRPTHAELAAHLELTPEKVETVLRLAREPVSLHTPMGEDDGEELGNLLADSSPDPADVVATSWRRRYLDQALKVLNEREATVLSQRFGLDDDKPKTLDEIGRRLGLTRERVRQIECKGLAKLREPSRARALADLCA